jgi:hypothetical protein
MQHFTVINNRFFYNIGLFFYERISDCMQIYLLVIQINSECIWKVFYPIIQNSFPDDFSPGKEFITIYLSPVYFPLSSSKTG